MATQAPAFAQPVDLHGITLRALSPADASDYRRFRLQALADFPDAFTSSAEEEARSASDWVEKRLAPSASNVVLGAYAGLELVGIVGLERKARSKERHKALLYGMVVAPPCQGRGVGRALVAAAIAHGRQWHGVEQILLTVTAGNATARRLYCAAGFVRFGCEPKALKIGDHYHDKEQFILMLRHDTP